MPRINIPGCNAAGATSSFQDARHADLGLLAEHGRTLLPRSDQARDEIEITYSLMNFRNIVQKSTFMG
jgi:hypothetical protein